MTDTHHPRLTGEGQGGRRKFPRGCDTCSPPQHLSSNHSISGPCSNNAPRIWGGGRALCGWTCRKYTYINTSIDVWLLCVQFLLRNKTIERALLKPGDHLFPFLSFAETPRAATRAGSIGSSPLGERREGMSLPLELPLEPLIPLLAAVGQIPLVSPAGSGGRGGGGGAWSLAREMPDQHGASFERGLAQGSGQDAQM